MIPHQVKKFSFLKRDLQDLAMHQDRTVGELIRVVLEQYVYGARQRMHAAPPVDQAP